MTRLNSFLEVEMVTYDSLHLSVTLGLLFHAVKIVYPMREMSDEVPGEKPTLVLWVSPHRPALDLRL